MMKYLVSILMVFSFVKSYASLRTELMFSSATEVSPRNEITLYDIVEAKNLTEEMIQELREIKVAAGTKSRIEKSELTQALRSLKARFVLPSEIKIVRSQSSVSRMELERKIKNHVFMSCLDCDVEVQVSSVPSHIPADWVLDYATDFSKTSVMIPIYSKSDTQKKGWVVAQIKRIQSVPVLNRAVKMGEVLEKSMFTIEKRSLQNFRESVTNLKSIDGMQAAHFIPAGQPLKFSDIKKETLVKRGQMVKVLVGTDSFEVTMPGQVEENGSLGEVIKVKNLDSQKVFAGRVVDRGIVRIE